MTGVKVGLAGRNGQVMVPGGINGGVEVVDLALYHHVEGTLEQFYLLD